MQTAHASRADLPPCNLAKIVATIGPASDSPDAVRRLIELGVSVFRLNFSHGDLDGHAKRLRTIRDTAAAMNRPVAVLGDLQGPKIRVGRIPETVGSPHSSGGGAVRLEVGQDIIFRKGQDLAAWRVNAQGQNELVVGVTYEPLVDEVAVGHKVLVNDGAIRLLAVDRSAGELRLRVVVGGTISSGKGINLPQSELSVPAMTERDQACVAWAVEHELDYLALSFVRKAEEVRALKDLIAHHLRARLGSGEIPPDAWIPIIAKIEKPQALTNLESIIDAADGAMVARGDLGVEMDIYRVPVAQKRIVSVCAQYGKPCIVATQMLETMIENVIPTRAEASDVANAIFDGADAVMLSAETATGKHPALVVETMARIVSAAEAHLRDLPEYANPPTRFISAHRGTAALAHGAWAIARELDARVVVAWSQNGGTARYLSQNHLHIPVLAYSSSPRAAARMALLRGIFPLCMTPPGTGTLADWNAHVDHEVIARGIAAQGDAIVLVAGRPLGRAKATNTIAIARVGEASSGYRTLNA